MADLPETWRTPEYKKIYGKLDPNIKEACKIAFKKWRDNPDSLTIKPLNKVFGSNEAVSAEISYSVRALGYHNKKKNAYVWFWVGTHEDYNHKITKDFLKNKVNDIKENEVARDTRDAAIEKANSNESFIGLRRPNLHQMRQAFDPNYKSDKNDKNKSSKDGPRKYQIHKNYKGRHKLSFCYFTTSVLCNTKSCQNKSSFQKVGTYVGTLYSKH